MRTTTVLATMSTITSLGLRWQRERVIIRYQECLWGVSCYTETMAFSRGKQPTFVDHTETGGIPRPHHPFPTNS